MAMRVRVGCEFNFQVDIPVAMVMMVRPDGAHRFAKESTDLFPEVSFREYMDSFGNRCWRFTAPGGPITLRYDAIVVMENPADLVVTQGNLSHPSDLPDHTLMYTLPSRQIESDLLLNDAWQLFGHTPPTWERVQAICDWVHQNVQYIAEHSGPEMLGSAVAVFQRRSGVCRDFALMSIAFCRALNIPARYVFGYLPDIGLIGPQTPMDFHAWFEAFIDGQWHTFDARHNVQRIGRIAIGRGRDAIDVAISTAYGDARLLKMVVWADQVPNY